MTEATSTPAATTETDDGTNEAPATEQAADTTTPDAETAPKPTETIEFWKAKAREQEQRAKANKKDLDRLAQIDDANKTETQRLTERAEAAEKLVTELQERAKTSAARAAITDAATTAKAVDTETVYLHIQAKGGLEFDDDGAPVDAAKAVAALAKEKPHLFTSPAAGTRDTTAKSVPLALNDGDGLTNALMSKLGID